MLLLVFAILLVFAFIVPKSKYVFAAEVILMLFMFSFISYEGDWQTYSLVYLEYASSALSWHYEPAFSILMMLCSRLGLPYVWFRFLICLIYCIILTLFLKSVTKYYAIIGGLTLVFPFFVFVATMRSGIACPLVLCAFVVLALNKQYTKEKFILLILLATMFHYSCIVFLPFIIVDKKISNTKKVFLFFLAAMVAVLLNFTTVIPNLLSVFMSREKTLSWFSQNEGTANLTGAICDAVLVLVNFLISKKAYEISSREFSTLEQHQIRFSRITYEVSYILIFLLPFIWLSSPFLRLVFIAFPMIIVSMVNALSTLKKDKIERLYIVAIVALGVVFRLYNDLPYLKAGSIFFGEFLNNDFIFF